MHIKFKIKSKFSNHPGNSSCELIIYYFIYYFVNNIVNNASRVNYIYKHSKEYLEIILNSF